ncbi:hypothetical protein ABZX90_41560 [Streptomyces sp. NPDC002935]|uniref:hypothetical protein n=1 Tax=Streptomyces sp. NPDC002935 TaxID=3154545 RepID=UPI0033B23E2E
MEKNVVQLAPSALQSTAETLTGSLGADNWQVSEVIIDGIVSLDGPHDRRIGMRLLGDGSSIQLWATGGAEPADREPIEGIAPLPYSHRWHTPVHIGWLEADQDPAAVLYDAISNRLLPAFDAKPLYVGHRPWEEAFDSALSQVLDESSVTTGTSLRDCGPEAHTQPHDVGHDPEHSADTEPAPVPEAAPEPELQAPAAPTEAKPKPEPAGKRIRRPKAAPSADDGDAKSSTTRKRTAAKPATPAADGEPKPRLARKRASKPTTS